MVTRSISSQCQYIISKHVAWGLKYKGIQENSYVLKTLLKNKTIFLYDRIALIGKLRINMSSSKYAKIDFALKSFLEFRWGWWDQKHLMLHRKIWKKTYIKRLLLHFTFKLFWRSLALKNVCNMGNIDWANTDSPLYQTPYLSSLN